MSTTTSTLPPLLPSSAGLRRFANYREFRSDPTGFLLARAAEADGIARIGIGPLTVYQITAPELVGDVLLTRHALFGRGQSARDLQMLVGLGLLTAEGEVWRKQRRLLAPPLTKKRVARYAASMVGRTKTFASARSDGEQLDVSGGMTLVTLQIVIDSLFGVEAPAGMEAVGGLLESAADHFERLITGALRFFPRWIPSRSKSRFLRDLKQLDALVYALIDARQRESSGGDDLLGQILEARYEDGSAMTRTQLRDEVITMFLAGHETTALTLSFALHYLATRPELQASLHEEVDSVLGDGVADAERANALVRCRAVFSETLRLCPPAWLLSRLTRESTTLAGHRLPKGSTIFVSPWVMHRNPHIFDRPDEFIPDRWLDGLEAELPRFAYIPFGAGPRICIGNHFAMMEGTVVLATLLQQLRFEAPAAPLKLQPSVTLRPAGPIQIRVHRR